VVGLKLQHAIMYQKTSTKPHIFQGGVVAVGQPQAPEEGIQGLSEHFGLIY